MADDFSPAIFLTHTIFALEISVNFYSTISNVILAGAFLAILIAVSVYVTKKVYKTAKDDSSSDISHSMLTEIRQARDAGEISEDEYRKIRTQLISAIRKNSLENIPLEELKKEKTPEFRDF